MACWKHVRMRDHSSGVIHSGKPHVREHDGKTTTAVGWYSSARLNGDISFRTHTISFEVVFLSQVDIIIKYAYFYDGSTHSNAYDRGPTNMLWNRTSELGPVQARIPLITIASCCMTDVKYSLSNVILVDKNWPHSINIWDTVTGVIPSCPVYKAPSYEPSLTLLAWFLPDLVI